MAGHWLHRLYFFCCFCSLLKIGKNVEHHLTYSLKETTAMWWSMLLCTRDAHIYCWLTVLVKIFNRAESGFTVSSGRTDHDWLNIVFRVIGSCAERSRDTFQVFICADGQFALKTASAAAFVLSSWENVENCFSHVCIIKHPHPLCHHNTQTPITRIVNLSDVSWQIYEKYLPRMTYLLL